MKRRLLRISEVALAVVVAQCLWTVWPAKVGAVGLDGVVAVGDLPAATSAKPQELGEGRLRFEVEPDDVEIYLDERYLGRAGELRGREVEGILAGSRLVDLRWGGERTFLEVVVPVGGTRTIRLDLNPPGTGSSPSSQRRSPVPVYSSLSEQILLGRAKQRGGFPCLS